MVYALESAWACVPGCGLTGEKALGWLCRLASLVIALAINPLALPVRAAGPSEPGVGPAPYLSEARAGSRESWPW